MHPWQAKRARRDEASHTMDTPGDLHVPPSTLSGDHHFRALETFQPMACEGGSEQVRKYSPLTGRQFQHWRAMGLQQEAARLPAAQAAPIIARSVENFAVTIL